MSSPLDLLLQSRIPQGGVDTSTRMLDLAEDVVVNFSEELKSAQAEKKNTPLAKDAEKKPDQPLSKTDDAPESTLMPDENPSPAKKPPKKDPAWTYQGPRPPVKEGTPTVHPSDVEWYEGPIAILYNEPAAETPPVEPEIQDTVTTTTDTETELAVTLPKEPSIEVAEKVLPEGTSEIIQVDVAKLEETSEKTSTIEISEEIIEVSTTEPNDATNKGELENSFQEPSSTSSTEPEIEVVPATTSSEKPEAKNISQTAVPISEPTALEDPSEAADTPTQELPKARGPTPMPSKDAPKELPPETAEIKEADTPDLNVEDTQPEPIKQAPPENKEADSDRKTGIKSEHTLEKEAKTPSPSPTNTDATAKIAQGLNQIATNTAVSSPVASKVPAPIVEALKVHQPELAKAIEGAKAPLEGPVRVSVNLRSSEISVKQGEKKILTNTAEGKIEEIREKVVKQMRFQLKLMLRDNVSRMQMKLNPQYLGKVDIRMTLEKSAVTANFVVENQTVKELLQKSSSQLQEMLAEQGIDAQEIDVQVASDHSSGEQSGRAFASAEDRKIMKEWIGSFVRFDGDAETSESESQISEDDPEQMLNIMA